MPSPKTGDVRADGYTFTGYTPRGGKSYELWLSPAAIERRRVSAVRRQARKRALMEGVSFNVTLPYLESIYPSNGLCPIFQTPMIRGERDGRDNSPSLDRIIPSEGYVVGNVRWISNGANRMRASLSIQQLERLLAYLKREDAKHA